MSSYKEEHQRFMTGHTGTSFYELAWLYSVTCVSCALRDATVIWTDGISDTNEHRCIRFIMDFLIIVVPSLLSMTLLSSYSLSIFILETVMTFLLYLFWALKHGSKTISANLQKNNLDERKTFVSYFRSVVNLLTSLAILAVDFQVFPRRFAKTEEFGYGMMDFGVGFFVISNAIVSPEARGRENSLPKIKMIRKAFVSSLPLLILGFARLISVKGTDYHEHVTEYGVHWNFFFTLAALKISSTIIYCIIPNIKPGISGSLILICHQFCLSNGLSDYIILGSNGKMERTSLVDANREGIFSLPGYIALYMMSVELGRFIFKKRTNLREWLKTAFHMFVAVIVLAYFMEKLHLNVQMVSRRFVNASFVFGTVTYTCVALFICLIGDIAKTYSTSLFLKNGEKYSSTENDAAITENNHVYTDNNGKSKMKGRTGNIRELCLMEAISFNSLLFFLSANLMTGVVNMSMSTIYANTFTAMSVLITYSFLLCLLSAVLYLKNIKTKIW